MEPLVSVILPTYNVEKYLEQCVESVCAQTYKNLEIIIVIDGATDDSYEIAQECKKKDNRIKVVWQSNAGSGPARNNGLKNANGKYVMFVDPDDWVDTQIVEEFVQQMEIKGVDLVTSRAINVFYNDQDKEIKRVENNCQERYFDSVKCVREGYYSLYTEHLLGAPTKKMYRMSIIRENQVEFPDLRRSQDIVFNYRYYEYVNKVYVSPKNLYYYRINKTANVLKLPKDYYKTVILIHYGILDMYKSWGMSPSESEEVGYNNIFLDRIERCLEAKILKKESMEEILDCSEVQKIIKQAYPYRLDKRVIKRCILMKNVTEIKLLVMFKRIIREVR